MAPYLLATAACVLTVALILWLIKRTHDREQRQREALRKYSPDFNDKFWNGGPDNRNDEDDLPDAIDVDVDDTDADDTDVVELEPAGDDFIDLERDGKGNFKHGRSGDHAFAEGEPTATDYTSSVEPNPIFGTRGTVRNACTRAAKQLEKCKEAADRHDFAAAEDCARAALEELETMRRDHWFAPRILTWLGYLRYERGFSVEAREHWEHAEQIALEWHEQCSDMLPVIRRNLRIFHENF